MSYVNIQEEGSTKIKVQSIGGENWQKVLTLTMNVSLVGGYLTVGASSEVEVKVGANRLTDRQVAYVQNRSTTHSIFLGPTGVTKDSGWEILPGERWWLGVGDQVAVYLIADTGGSCNVRVLEGS